MSEKKYLKYKNKYLNLKYKLQGVSRQEFTKEELFQLLVDSNLLAENSFSQELGLAREAVNFGKVPEKWSFFVDASTYFGSARQMAKNPFDDEPCRKFESVNFKDTLDELCKYMNQYNMPIIDDPVELIVQNKQCCKFIKKNIQGNIILEWRYASSNYGKCNELEEHSSDISCHIKASAYHGFQLREGRMPSDQHLWNLFRPVADGTLHATGTWYTTEEIVDFANRNMDPPTVFGPYISRDGDVSAAAGP